MFDILKSKIAVRVANSRIGNRAINKLINSRFAETKLGGLAVTLIVAVIVIVIAVSLLPVIFSATSSSLTSNVTSNAHFSSAVTLTYLIPLIFVAGLLVVILYMMFEKIRD